MSKEVKELLGELLTGVLGYEALLAFLTAGICLWKGYALPAALLGILAGFAAVCLMLLDMGRVTDHCVNSGDEKYAQQKTTLHATVRKILLLAALIVCWKLPQINLITMLLAIMGLKAGVYFQPLVHKKRGRT